MPITTVNDKVGVMEWCSVFEPGLPISPGALGVDDQQQLLNDFPGVLWGTSSSVFILDMNTRLRVYLCDLYGLNHQTADLTSMICLWLDTHPPGDYDQRFQRLIDLATP